VNTDLLAYLAGADLVLWGLAHVLPTRTVADGFGNIGSDNRRILVMEWLAEGIAHILIGLLVIAVAAAGEAGNPPQTSPTASAQQPSSRLPRSR
jgi:hypothetical protein